MRCMVRTRAAASTRSSRPPRAPTTAVVAALAALREVGKRRGGEGRGAAYAGCMLGSLWAWLGSEGAASGGRGRSKQEPHRWMAASGCLGSSHTAGEAELADAVIATAERLPRARWVITTVRHWRGSIRARINRLGGHRLTCARADGHTRCGTAGAAGGGRCGGARGGLGGGVGAGARTAAGGGVVVCPVCWRRQRPRVHEQRWPGYLSRTRGVHRRLCAPLLRAVPVRTAPCGTEHGARAAGDARSFRAALRRTARRDPQVAARQAQAAAERAAALNADAGRGGSYAASGSGGGAATGTAVAPSRASSVVARVTLASIAGLPKVRACAAPKARRLPPPIATGEVTEAAQHPHHLQARPTRKPSILKPIPDPC
jgi:hypothetical protein